MEEEKIKAYLRKRAGLRMYYAGIVMLPSSVLCFFLSLMFFFTDPSTIEVVDSFINPAMLFFLIFGLLGITLFVIGLAMFLIGRKRKTSNK